MNIELLRQELIRDEGYRLGAYKDTKGLWTIGIGHLLPAGDHSGLVWTDAQVQSTFLDDTQAALQIAQSLPAYHCLDTDARQRALANMAFEMGHRLLAFNTFLSLLTQKKWIEAGNDLRTTLWYKEVPKRAERIIRMIQNG